MSTVPVLKRVKCRRSLALCAAMGGLLLAVLACDVGIEPSLSPTPTLPPEEYTVYIPVTGGESAIPTPTPLPSTPPPEPPTPTPLPPPVFKPGSGIQIHLFGPDMNLVLNWAQGLGVEWVKQQVTWHTIEHQPGEYEWGELDRIVNLCEGYGFKLMLSVTNAPNWLRPIELEHGPPSDAAEFGHFVELLAERYRGRVGAYELWNEPNLAREWRGAPLDPALFVALVREGASAIRAADPDALVISGGLGVTGINDGVEAVDDRVYLRGMYEAGIAQWVDGIGAHPYGFANPPEASFRDPEQVAPTHNDHPSFFFRDTLEDYRAIMLEHGDAERQIWVTEFGWPSVENIGEVDTTGWEYARHVTEVQQGEYIVRAFRMGEGTRWIGPMFLWNLNLATLWGPGVPVSAYSLLRPDGEYRPAYIALRLAESLEP